MFLKGKNYETYEKSPGVIGYREIPGVRECLYADATVEDKADSATKTHPTTTEPNPHARELWDKNEHFLFTLSRWSSEILKNPELETLRHSPGRTRRGVLVAEQAAALLLTRT